MPGQLIVNQGIHVFCANRLDLLVQATGALSGEIPNEKRNIFAAIAKWGKLEGNTLIR